MSIHNTMFIIFGIVGLVLSGAGQLLIENSTTEVPQSTRSSIGPNIPGFSLSGEVGSIFGRNRGTVRQTDSTQKTIGILVALIAHVLIAVGATFFAIGKRRSPWFGLLGLLSPIGLLFLAVLDQDSNGHEANA